MEQVSDWMSYYLTIFQILLIKPRHLRIWRTCCFDLGGCNSTIALILSSSGRIFPSPKMCPRHFSRLWAKQHLLTFTVKCTLRTLSRTSRMWATCKSYVLRISLCRQGMILHDRVPGSILSINRWRNFGLVLGPIRVQAKLLKKHLKLVYLTEFSISICQNACFRSNVDTIAAPAALDRMSGGTHYCAGHYRTRHDRAVHDRAQHDRAGHYL